MCFHLRCFLLSATLASECPTIRDHDSALDLEDMSRICVGHLFHRSTSRMESWIRSLSVEMIEKAAAEEGEYEEHYKGHAGDVVNRESEVED